MKYLIIFLLGLYGATASAQDCDSESVQTMPGKWLPRPQDVFHARPSAADIAGARKTMGRIEQFFREHHQPIGMDSHQSYSFDDDRETGEGNYGNRYIHTLRNYNFYCAKGQKRTNPEGTGNYVHINPGSSLRISFAEIPVYDEYRKTVNGSPGFHLLDRYDCVGGKLPDFSDGYHLPETPGDYTVWITYPGKQPFRYVSRKEFLEKQVAICEAEIKDLNQKYASPEWKEMMSVLKDQKEKIDNDMKESLSVFEKTMEAYRQDLKKDEAWLNEMAVIKYEGVNDPVTRKHLYSRFAFTTVDNPLMGVPIMPNPGYYNRKLPKWAPQFIVVNVTNIDSFVAKSVRKLVADNIDFFKSLLADNE